MTSLENTHFLIYKTTNLINGKIYIGKHIARCIDDGYMGSGKLLKRAISKYGIENFTREILFMCSSEEEMNAKEAELITEEFCNQDTNYNLCVGGHGGFSYINREGLNVNDNQKKASINNLDKSRESTKEKWSNPDNIEQLKLEMGIKSKIGWTNNPHGRFNGKCHTEETKRLKSQISKERGLQSGEKNSQFGSMWITNGEDKKKIKNTDSIPEGWRRGRK